MQFANTNILYCHATRASSYFLEFIFYFLFSREYQPYHSIYIGLVTTTYMINVHVCKIEFIIWEWN